MFISLFVTMFVCLLETLRENGYLATLKLHSIGPLYNNTVIGTLTVDGWAVTIGTARRGLAGCGPAEFPPLCIRCNSPPINGQCTNFILFDVAL